MKIHYCKICSKKGKRFSGLRRKVRQHLKEEHGIRGKSKDLDNKILPSQLTLNTISEEL